MVWFAAVLIETVLCSWVQLERRAIRRRTNDSANLPPLHRLYSKALGKVRTAVATRQRPKLPKKEATRRTGLVTFAFITAAMAPPLAMVMIDGVHMSPVLGQLIAWPTLWIAPVLTFAPARLLALLIAVWRGWLRMDDDGRDGGTPAIVPSPSGHDGSHSFLFPN